jgi:Protease inhibitor Inh
MRVLLISVIAASALGAAAPALAQDAGPNGYGSPLKPSDAAAQPWLVESHGQTTCKLRLESAQTSPGVYRVSAGDCGGALPTGVAGWKPDDSGLSLVDSQGQVVVKLNRWSNSLMVAPRASGVDLQLQRAG